MTSPRIPGRRAAAGTAAAMLLGLALAAHAQAARADEGKALRVEGAKLCGDGDYAMGTHKLRDALDDIGVSSAL